MMRPPRRADRLLERGLGHGAVGVVGDERGERPFALARRIADDALDVGLGQEAQQVDAARGHIGVGRERDHPDIARARELPDRTDGEREQGSEDDLGAFVERLLGGLLRARRAAAVVLHQQLDVGIVEFRERHLGGIAHRLRGHRRVAARRQRQDQADLDLALADTGRRLRRRRRLRAGNEIADRKTARAAGQQDRRREGGEPCGAWSRGRRGSRRQYSEHGRLLTQTARL